MKEIVSKLTLYVAQPGDTLHTIAMKHKMNESDLLKYNPLLKHRNIKSGYPINILVSEVNEDCPIAKEEKEYSRSENIKNIQYLSHDYELAICLIFYVKELQFAQVFAPDFTNILKSKTLLFFEQLIQKYEHLTLEGNIDKLRTLFGRLLESYLDFKKIVHAQDEKTFKDYQVELRKHYDNFLRFLLTLEERLNNQSIQQKTNQLWHFFNLIAIKLIAGHYEEVEETFQQIISIIVNITN